MMDKEKISVILSWPPPRTVGDVRSFHGHATFYRKLITNFSHICVPMLETIKGGRKCKFAWSQLKNEAIKFLKKKVSEKPILSSL